MRYMMPKQKAMFNQRSNAPVNMLHGHHMRERASRREESLVAVENERPDRRCNATFVGSATGSRAKLGQEIDRATDRNSGYTLRDNCAE